MPIPAGGCVSCGVVGGEVMRTHVGSSDLKSVLVVPFPSFAPETITELTLIISRPIQHPVDLEDVAV